MQIYFPLSARLPPNRFEEARADAVWSSHPGRLAQRESASFTPKRSLVRSQYRPPQLRAGNLLIVTGPVAFVQQRSTAIATVDLLCQAPMSAPSLPRSA